MSKYEVVREGRSHGLSGGTHTWTVGQVLDGEKYTKTTIATLLANGIIVPVQPVKKAAKQAAAGEQDAGS